MLVTLMTCTGLISFYCYRFVITYRIMHQQWSDEERRLVGASGCLFCQRQQRAFSRLRIVQRGALENGGQQRVQH